MYLSTKAVPRFAARCIENASYPHCLGAVQWVDLWIKFRPAITWPRSVTARPLKVRNWAGALKALVFQGLQGR